MYEAWDEMLADEDDSSDVSDGGGEDRSSLNGESLMAEMGEGEGEEVILAGVGDLASLGLLRRGLSPDPLLCCLACWRHLARRFLNHTCNNQQFTVNEITRWNPTSVLSQIEIILTACLLCVTTTHLNPGLWQIYFEGNLLSHEYIRIASFLKQGF